MKTRLIGARFIAGEWIGGTHVATVTWAGILYAGMDANRKTARELCLAAMKGRTL
jgi:hypothetical protein